MIRATLLAVLAGAMLLAGTAGASAQTGGLVSGAVTGVERNDAGELTAFSIVDETGATHRFQVGADTEYGLENQAGDRWTAKHSAEPVEAARRLEDNQRRFAPVTVSASGGEALSVVQKESGRLETNLGYLFAVFAVTWAAFFAYIFVVSRRQRDLDRQIAQLKARLEEDS